MEPKQIELYEFLVESELQQYYNSIKNELKISNASHLKYATDEDLKQIGLSRPEIRRLRKFYEKYYPHGYLSKIKRLLQNPSIKKDDGSGSNQIVSSEPMKTANSPSKTPSNKHIIPADSICVNKQLGTGEFGIVQQGVWTNGAERIQVAIKCLCRERMQSNPMEFLKEAAIMHAIEHENIVRLYGVVLDTDSLMLVTELAHLRSLLECLKDSGLRVSFLTVPTLCEFAQQICNGMMYLENKRLIHRDLAARNILVFSKNKVKISDFGLSRALGVGKDYYKTNFNVNLKLPIAWCAPECINYLRFTNASDVWAYGVCLWEMFSYGFQPWAALTGLQILDAIDEPNYQRLEQPECCPREYYSLMLKCWQHDPIKRPKFSEVYQMLPDMKPEQLKTIASNCEPKKDHLMYRQGEIITVLDKITNSPYWKGVLNSGKTGLFNPANTVAYLEGLPSSTNRDSFCRTSDRSSKRKLRTEMISSPQNDLKHTGHVGLDGAYFGDVAFIASSQNYNRLPRQIVTPYKPSEDIEQTPLLLPPTPTSPDSLQTASGYFPEDLTSTNPTFINSNENTPKHHQINSFISSFDFPLPSSSSTKQTSSSSSATTMFSSSNPFVSEQQSSNTFALQNNNYGGLEVNAFTNANLVDDDHTLLQDTVLKNSNNITSVKWNENDITGNSTILTNETSQHEYHEISDDEITAEKVFDLGPSLLDEINSMFGSISTANSNAAIAIGTTNSIGSGVVGIDLNSEIKSSPDFDHTNKKNELTELTSKLNRNKSNSNDTNGNNKLNRKNKTQSGTVKQISVKDEKILNQAIEIANEISARSMTDLVNDHPPPTQSPKRKFSFRFPNLSHHISIDKDHHHHHQSSNFNGNSSNISHNTKERKNFSEELRNIPDLQRFRSLTEIEKYDSDIRIPLFDKESTDFCFKKSREILTRPLNIDISPRSNTITDKMLMKQQHHQQQQENDDIDKNMRDFIGENLIDIENTLKALNLDFLQTYNELGGKTDSTETLFGDQFTTVTRLSSIESNNSNTNSSSKLSNGGGNGGGGGIGIGISNNLNSSSTTTTAVNRPNYDFGGNFNGKYDLSNQIEKQLIQHQQQLQHQHTLNIQLYNDVIEKLDEKRSSTPDTGFASRETNLSLSRRSSSKSNYSPQENYFITKDGNESRCYMNLRNESNNTSSSCSNKIINSSSPIKNMINTTTIGTTNCIQNSPIGDYSSSTGRQRSMSFTDNYDLKSPVLSEPQNHRKNRSGGISTGSGNGQISDFIHHRSPNSFRNKPRRVITYKPRSIRARTLRRLSYNPIILDSSSSSSSDSDFDHSIAHSECDIRTKMIVSSSSSKRRRQYLNRKTPVGVSNDEIIQDRIYGSNTSIKSAPHYNYCNERHSSSSSQINNRCQISHYNYELDLDDEKIYDFGGRGPGNNYGAATNTLIKPPRAFAMNGSKYTQQQQQQQQKQQSQQQSQHHHIDIIYSEFDVTKLTGKSPTTQTFFHHGNNSGIIGNGNEKLRNNSTIPPPPPAPAPAPPSSSTTQQQPAPGFQWPEKIHASTVKQNDLLWRQQQKQQQPNNAQNSLFTNLKVKHAFSSDSSSSDADEIEYQRDFHPRIPPSPAP